MKQTTDEATTTISSISFTGNCVVTKLTCCIFSPPHKVEYHPTVLPVGAASDHTSDLMHCIRTASHIKHVHVRKEEGVPALCLHLQDLRAQLSPFAGPWQGIHNCPATWQLAGSWVLEIEKRSAVLLGLSKWKCRCAPLQLQMGFNIQQKYSTKNSYFSFSKVSLAESEEGGQ